MKKIAIIAIVLVALGGGIAVYASENNSSNKASVTSNSDNNEMVNSNSSSTSGNNTSQINSNSSASNGSSNNSSNGASGNESDSSTANLSNQKEQGQTLTTVGQVRQAFMSWLNSHLSYYPLSSNYDIYNKAHPLVVPDKEYSEVLLNWINSGKQTKLPESILNQYNPNGTIVQVNGLHLYTSGDTTVTPVNGYFRINVFNIGAETTNPNYGVPTFYMSADGKIVKTS